MLEIARPVGKLLRGAARSRHFDSAQQQLALVQSHWLVRAYYLASLAVTFKLCVDLHAALWAGAPSSLLWPVFWLKWVPLGWAHPILVLAALVAAGVAVAIPHVKLARAAFCLLFVFSVATRYSYGFFSHPYHIWLWLSVVFVFFPLTKQLPLGSGRPAARHVVISWFFAAQVLVALFYSLSGLWKALRGVIVPPNGISSFAPDALPTLVLERWTYNEYPTVLQEVFHQSLWIGWPAHLLVIYVELFALVAVFRPEMHRLFGILLMSFHLAVWLLMGIAFPYQPMTMSLLFVLSPMAVGRKFDSRRFVLQVPLFGDLLSLALPPAYPVNRATDA